MSDDTNHMPERPAPQIPAAGDDVAVANAVVARPPAKSRTVVNFAERFGLVVVWAMVVLGFTLYEPSTYLSVGNIANILGSQAVLVVMTLALVLPMTAGDFDLSVGGVVAMSSMVVAVLNTQHGWPILAAAGFAIVLGGLVGLFNGVIITAFNIDSLIVTLGVQTLLSGAVLWLSNSQTVSGVSPALVQYVISDRLFGIPLEFYYATGITVIIWYILDFTVIGRRLLFVGRGREVARLSGVRVARTRVIALVMSGVVSAVAGVLYVGSTGAADPSSAFNFLLPAFAASFLGFTAIRPGRFNAWGTYVAVYFLISGITGLELAGIAAFVQQLFYGAALILAVVLRQIVRGRQEAAG